MSHTGTIVNAKATFAFIWCEALDRKVFLHVSEFKSAFAPRDGMNVTFDLAPSLKPGLPDMAVNVRPLRVEIGANALAGGR
jgi:cold shock CspA family protein